MLLWQWWVAKLFTTATSFSVFYGAYWCIDTILACKSKELPNENIKSPTTPGNNIAPKLSWMHDAKTALKFK